MNKLVDEAPYHPGYEDAVVNPTPKYTGMNPAKMIWKTKPLTTEEIQGIRMNTVGDIIAFARAIEQRHGIK
jgi:hypothetical protein